MAYKDGVLTISDWQKGQADSAYLGFSNIQNCEVFDTPGVLKIGNRTVSRGYTFTGLPVAYAEDSYGNNYTLTNDGKCYKNGTAIQTGLGLAWDLAIYNDYLLVTHSSVISAYGPLYSGSAQWFGNWKTGLGGVYYAKMLASKNGDLFIGNGNSIAKISSFVAGAPTVAPTATLNTSVATLPVNQAVTTFVELGIYFLIGTQALSGSWASATNFKVANIYLWDKEDTKMTALAGVLNEASVQSMIVNNHLAYIVAGTRGNVYVSDTSTQRKLRRIPWNQNKIFGSTLRVYPNAMAFSNNNNLLIGTSTLSDAFGASISPSRHGVYEMDVNTEKYPTVLKNLISTGNNGSTQVLSVGFVFVGSTDSIYIGWQDGSSYGMDTTDYVLCTNSIALAESQIYRVGTKDNPTTFEHLEFTIGRPLTTGQEITIWYRKNATDDYTLIGNFTYTTLGAVISHATSALIAKAEIVQVKVALTQPTTSTIGNNIDLINLQFAVKKIK